MIIIVVIATIPPTMLPSSPSTLLSTSSTSNQTAHHHLTHFSRIVIYHQHSQSSSCRIVIHIIFRFPQVVTGPYTEESMKPSDKDYAEVRMKLPANTDLSDSKSRNDLEDKIATIYVTGKSKLNTRRKKRAVGSVSAKVRKC